MAKGGRKRAPRVVGGLLAAGVLAMGGAESAVASACPEHDGADSGGSASAASSASGSAGSNANSSAKANSANKSRGGGGGKADSGRNNPSTSGGDPACTNLTARTAPSPCI